MASKLPFLIGLTGGYVLGTRAGRAQYEKIKAAAGRVVESPAVRTRVDSTKAKVSAAVKRQGETVTDKVVESVKERLFGGPAQPNSTPVAVPEAQVRPLD